jgi:hypothetical protein
MAELTPEPHSIGGENKNYIINNTTILSIIDYSSLHIFFFNIILLLKGKSLLAKKI